MVDFAFNTAHQGLPAWHDRSEKCVDLVSAIGIDNLSRDACVADVGCGDKKLAAALKRRGIGLAYQGFDLRPQSPDVSLFDADSDLLPKKFDVVAVLGVIEYLSSVQKFFGNVQALCRYLVVSHVPADLSSYTADELDRLGWRHHMACAEVEMLLAGAGFDISATTVTDDRKTKLWMCRSAA